MKASTSQLVFGTLVGVLLACIGFSWIGQNKTASDGSSRTVKVAHGLPVTHPVHEGIQEFARELITVSNGALAVQIFPNGQLGKETVCLEKAQQGQMDIIKVSSSPVGSFVPLCKLFSLPYLFRDRDHYWNVLDGEVGKDLLTAMGTQDNGDPSGLVGLTYFDAGSRSFYATSDLTGPDSLEGLKIRVMADPVAEATVKALGASAVTMSFGELYTSLQQRGVDGAENNPPSLYSSRHFEACKNYLLDEHSRVPDVLIASEAFWESLNDVEKQWVQQAAEHASKYQRAKWAEASQKSLDELKANGVVIREVDKTLFQELTTGVVDEFAKGETKTFVDRIKEVK